MEKSHRDRKLRRRSRAVVDSGGGWSGRRHR
ncbi:hypothetical protein A2U01_0093726, partial [Trifolium medium]|nr:hypothetical protein [Trifolium medium]